MAPDTASDIASAVDRRTFVRGTGLAGLAGLAGCTGGGGGGTATEEAAAHIGMVYATGGLDDGSFNDQAQQGIQQAKEDFGVASDRTQPSEVSQFKNFQQQFAQSTDPDYDLVCCIGFLQTDALKQTSKSFPDQNFMIVDSEVEQDNVGSYVFREHEGSYLTGVLAGMLTGRDFSAGAGSTSGDGKNVGFVGGVEGSLIKKFEAGYLAGVQSVDSDVEVQSTYVGSFSDPQGGKEAALSMYNNGADVIYHASGNTGTGVFQAAQEQEKFAIGVDRDQSVTKSSYANVILASMVKRVDTAVYKAVESIVNDNFEGGSVVTLGLSNDGVAITYGDSLGGSIPEDVKSEITSAREGIVAGDISVPTDPKNV
jgi:basic membrane protein A